MRPVCFALFGLSIRKCIDSVNAASHPNERRSAKWRLGIPTPVPPKPERRRSRQSRRERRLGGSTPGSPRHTSASTPPRDRWVPRSPPRRNRTCSWPRLSSLHLGGSVPPKVPLGKRNLHPEEDDDEENHHERAGGEQRPPDPRGWRIFRAGARRAGGQERAPFGDHAAAF